MVDVYPGTPDEYRDRMEYKPALGYHITGEYEGFFESGVWSMIFGVKYYKVTYDIDSWTFNGTSMPISSLEDKYKKLNGNGIDLNLSLLRYF